MRADMLLCHGGIGPLFRRLDQRGVRLSGYGLHVQHMPRHRYLDQQNQGSGKQDAMAHTL